MRVPEKTHSVPCSHCSGDHKDWQCMWDRDEWIGECPHCKEVLHYDLESIGWCMDCNWNTEVGVPSPSRTPPDEGI